MPILWFPEFEVGVVVNLCTVCIAQDSCRKALRHVLWEESIGVILYYLSPKSADVQNVLV